MKGRLKRVTFTESCVLVASRLPTCGTLSATAHNHRLNRCPVLDSLQSQEMEASEVYRLLEGRIIDAETEKNGHKIYYVDPQKHYKDEDELFQVFHIGQNNPDDPPLFTKCVLLMGATRAGKSTFISAAVNYLFGVEFDDPYRLQVKEETENGRRETDSTTDIITVYKIYYKEGMQYKHNFVIIDTPGLDDTRGKEKQESIMSNLNSLFTTDFGVDALHCLGIVAKGNENSCGEYQKKVFEAIISLLGDCVSDITHIIATHALEKVSVDAAMRDLGITFQELFQFDNGCLFDPKETCMPYDPRKRWERMTEQYGTFFGALMKAPSVSIEILREKKMYDRGKENLRKQIGLFAASTEASCKAKEIYDKYNDLMEKNKNWRKTEFVELLREEELEKGTHAHNCSICKQTCSICSSMTCRVIPYIPMATGGGAGGLAAWASSALAQGLTVPVMGFAVTSTVAAPAVGFVISLSAGFAGYNFVKVAISSQEKNCQEIECKHPHSVHGIEYIKKIKETREESNIDEDMKSRYDEAVPKKKEADIKLKKTLEKQWCMRNRLSKDIVELLYHAKRIHELSAQGFNYMEDINRCLDGIQLSDKTRTGAKKRVVQVIKESMQELILCTADQIRDENELVKERLSRITDICRMTEELPTASK